MVSPVLEHAWNAAQPRLKHIQAAFLSAGKSRSSHTIRVTQLDAELLDQELVELLLEPINGALSLINSTLRSRFELELALFLKCLLYKLSVWNTGASYGAMLQNLKYVVPNTLRKQPTRSGLPRNTLLGHASLTLLIPYLHDRIRSHALSHAWPDAPSLDRRKKAWDLLNAAETLHALLALVNFVGFLWEGRYRTLSDRVLQMSLTPSRRSARIDVSYEFMNRQMVWHAFTEFLLFLLPLLSKRAIRRLTLQLKSLMSERFSWPVLLLKNILNIHPMKGNDGDVFSKRGKFATLPETQCAVCVENAAFNAALADPARVLQSFVAPPINQTDPATTTDGPTSHPIYNPYETTCGHIYCYQCIAEQMMRAADEVESNMGWECLRCGEFVKEAHRFRVESAEGEVTGSEYEFSSDLDISTNFSGSTYTFSDIGLSE